MNTFVTSAIVGTGQQPPETIVTGTPVDRLITTLPANDIERQILLAAGARSVYQRAGYSAQHIALQTDVAPDEHVPACSSKIADLIVTMQRNEHAKLMPEMLERLQQAGLRLPYAMLAEMLDYGSNKSEIQAALLPVLGERGRWLSRYNPAWSWVAQFPNTQGDTLPEVAETVWQEGTLGQRITILRLMRATDADRARAWLLDVWKKERAEARQLLLDTFANGLSAADEPFLASVLNDRSEHVQRLARSLLARIPTSALARHIVALADAMISYSHGKSPFLKKKKLIVHVPASSELAEERLNLEKKPAYVQISDELWYLQQVIALVAPEHWEESFAASADALLAMPQSGDEQMALVVAWTEAALLYNAQQWYAPLCKWWLSQKTNTRSHTVQDLQAVILSLFQFLPASEAERILSPLLNGDISKWAFLFLSLSTPCSHEFGLASLKALQKYVDAHKGDNHYDYYNWAEIVPHMAKILPAICFNQVCTLWPPVEQESWTNQQLHTMISLFIKQIELRKKLLEELG